jgi:Ger(x)C family germination protein
MKPNKIKKKLYFLVIAILACLFITRPDMQPAEQLDVEIALGVDVEKITENAYKYIVTRCVYVFEEEKKLTSKVIISIGDSFGISRENRAQLANKSSISGSEKLYILGEEYAKVGMRASVDILLKNPRVNDTGIFVVSRSKSSEIMEYEIEGYPSSADYIEGMIKNQTEANFFTKEFDAMNMYVRLDSEGRSVLLPYIELNEEGLMITGEAVFKEDKMITKVDIKDSRIMNMLTFNNVRGTITMQNDPKSYIDFAAKSNKKVKCIKKDDKYNFLIDLKLEGEIMSNTLKDRLALDSTAIKEFENDMAEQVKEECYKFIGKMKKEIKVDCLELGRVAAAKYGRRKGTNWDEVISNSTIDVNVKVKVDSHGRGDF